MTRRAGGAAAATGIVMLEYLPAEVREGLEAARKRDWRKGRRLRLQLGEAAFPIRRMWASGFAVDAARLTRLRGFVEIHEGPRRLLDALIIATRIEGDELICTFKRASPARDMPAPDYWRGDTAPAGLLSKD